MPRRFKITTKHGILTTPFFMPIATKGAVKSLTVYDLERLGAQIILSNTYHLYLRPGEELLQSGGGLHGFMKWDKPILTDSGGYQVFSLGARRVIPPFPQKRPSRVLPSSAEEGGGGVIAETDNSPQSSLVRKRGGDASLVKITDHGVEFRDHISGSNHFFTPEKVLDIQSAIGSDIRMVLDVCSEYPCTREKAEQDMQRTLRWAERSLKYKQKQGGDYLLFAIVQGGMYQDLREHCARALVDMPFDGYAIGGVSVGEPWEEARKVLDWVIPLLPEDKPRYLMGVGKPEQMIEACGLGIDMFDCVIPTREARHGRLYISPSLSQKRGEHDFPPLLQKRGLGGVIAETDNSPQPSLVRKRGGAYQTISITNEQYKTDFSPINPDSQLEELQTYTKAYLRHLFISQEPLALRLATLNNLETYLNIFT